MELNDTFIEPDEDLRNRKQKQIWSKASFRTRQDILYVFEAMRNPNRWEKAQNYADKIREQLEERVGSRADQDLIEMFLMNYYRFWNVERIKATRLMISEAKKKFEKLPKEDKDTIKEKAGDTHSYIDAMQIPITPTNELKQMMNSINLLTDGAKTEPNYKPKLFEIEGDV